MMERLREKKWVYALLSIFLAVMFWLYVRAVDETVMTTWIRNVQVVQTGKNVLTQQGLTVADLSDDTVDLKISASASVRDALLRSQKDITVSLDVSRCKEGENQLTYTPNWPVSVSKDSVALSDQSPRTITVQVEKLDTQAFAVEFQFQGKVADGYQAGTPAINPETVMISGPVEQVSRISKVAAILENENLDEQFAGDLPLTLLDASGQVLTGLDVTLDTNSAYVVLPVVVTKELPLTVNLIAGGGATENDVTWEIKPKTIRVSGLKENLEQLTEISVGSVDLSKVVGSKTVSRPIELDPSLENVSGITSATVDLTINGLATRTVDVDNIALINVPSGYNVVSETKSRSVEIRGKAEDLEKIEASQLNIVVDLTGVQFLGTRNILAKVYLNAANSVGVIGEYYIAVNFSR